MSTSSLGQPNTQNATVTAWIQEMAAICQPSHIFWCDGSEKENKYLINQAVKEGVLIKLDEQKLPGCYYHRSNPNDVARVEHNTYVCTEVQEEAGPTNNWANPKEMYAKLYGLCRGGMKGRTLYVVPYLMGPPGSPLAKVGVELTDSVYVAINMRIMTRMGNIAFQQLGYHEDFNRGLHCMLDLNPDRRFICHFPQDNAIISIGSAYGGNVLLGKKCLSLRIGSYLGRKEGWLAEHMLILGVESPSGEKTFVAAAFPSACGKTNFAMLIPPAHFKGWKVWTVGDDIAWMYPGTDGRLHAINPEAGYFGVMPNTNRTSNPNAVASISRDSIYTNVALLPDGDVWWEGKDGAPPKEALDWRGNPWTTDSKEKAAHPNSRFTAPMKNNPMLAAEVDDPAGVPVSAIIFGGRRSNTVPLIFQSFNWTHGVYIGATTGSEMTAAAVGGVGQVRRDPMAMLPFCGYHMGDYFAHWIGIRDRITHPPKIFHANWFRKDESEKFLWPGFCENMRILKWIVDRCHERVAAAETSLGWMPRLEDVDFTGMNGYDPFAFSKAQAINAEEWRKEIELQDEFFAKLQPHLPKEIIQQRDELVERLGLK